MAQMSNPQSPPSSLDFTSNNMLALSNQSTSIQFTQSMMDLAVGAIAPAGLSLDLVPVYKILYGLMLRKGNYDISSITTKATIGVGAAFGIHFVWSLMKPIFVNYFISSITIPVEHHAAKSIEKWLESKHGCGAQRHLKFTVDKVKYNNVTQTDDLDGQSRTAIPGGYFVFEGRPLCISFSTIKGIESKNNPPVTVSSYPYDYGQVHRVSGDTVTIYSLDTSGSLLRRFIKHVAAEEIKDARNTMTFTVGPDTEWARRVRPIRPLNTIDLDATIKADLIRDIDRFFAPTRSRWGYLLCGPPGTGKSSISLALAGHIGGMLYNIALGEVMNESHLNKLFRAAETHSIVLLEDIDSAGIVREKLAARTEDTPVGAGMSARMNDPTRGPSKQKKSPISLSGLLNAIDALQDGVVLIMTSNKPESLDKALIRPGRIDKQIYIGFASQAVAESIFKRFFSANDEEQGIQTENFVGIADLAAKFAAKIPEDAALVRVEAWVSNILAAKAAGKNIIAQDDEPEDTSTSEEDVNRPQAQSSDGESDEYDECDMHNLMYDDNGPY
ncbi:hypothetical protein N0V90_008688 [Kalmusia sp. IMI 367209]|nr:hypothetical protein N0V90_008688 [Kalmusia sp. IMI 367209]